MAKKSKGVTVDNNSNVGVLDTPESTPEQPETTPEETPVVDQPETEPEQPEVDQPDTTEDNATDNSDSSDSPDTSEPEATLKAEGTPEGTPEEPLPELTSIAEALLEDCKSILLEVSRINEKGFSEKAYKIVSDVDREISQINGELADLTGSEEWRNLGRNNKTTRSRSGSEKKELEQLEKTLAEIQNDTREDSLQLRKAKLLKQADKVARLEAKAKMASDRVKEINERITAIKNAPDVDEKSYLQLTKDRHNKIVKVKRMVAQFLNIEEVRTVRLNAEDRLITSAENGNEHALIAVQWLDKYLEANL